MKSASPVPANTPKRELLLKTALRLFNRDGYHAVGIDKILAESKLAKMTLYHHFASKEDLIVAALDWRAAQGRVAFAAYLAAAGPSPKKRFAALFDWYEAWFKSPEFQGCFFIRASGEYPEIDSKVHQAAIRQKAGQIAILKTLIADLGAKAADALAQQLYQVIEGSIVAAHMFGDPRAIDVARRTGLTLVDAAARG